MPLYDYQVRNNVFQEKLHEIKIYFMLNMQGFYSVS